MNHLFGESPHKWKVITLHGFYRIYVKEKNNKIFSNLDMDPRDNYKLAETKSLLWAEAQNSPIQGMKYTLGINSPSIVPTISGRWCSTDGSGKNQDIYSG